MADIPEEFRLRIEKYRRNAASMTHRQRAEYIHDMIPAASKLAPPGAVTRRWLSRQCGFGETVFGTLFAALAYGDVAAAFWDHIGSEASGHYVVHLWAKIRGKHKEGMDLREAIATSINPPCEPVQEPPPSPSEPPLPDFGTTKSKEFWARIKNLSAQYISERVPEMSDEERSSMLSKFETDMRVVVEELFAKISYRKTQHRDVALKSLSPKVRHACEVLGVSPPRFGHPIDLGLAKKKHRALSFELHPDRNNDPRVVEQYHEAQNAWQLVQQWCEIDRKEQRK